MKKGVSGKQVGDENAAKLRAWLDSVDEIPLHGGKPNKTAIARLAGLKDRQPLENNQACIELLSQAMRSKRVSVEARTDAERVKLEARIRALETRADKESAENFELKRRLKRLQHVERIIESGGRVIP